MNINSGTGNHAGVRAVGELFADAFAKLGMKTRWIPMGAVDRAGHLFAESGRPGQPCTILIGHLDTVFEPDSPFQSFERLSETVARGPGVVDAKGGNVVILEALAALKSVGRLDQHRFVVALSGDEEESGQPLGAARHDLLEAAKSCKTALGFEPGATHPHTATVARRGFTHWVLDVEATAGHSSRIFDPDIGAGAAFETARFLEALRQKLGGRPFLSFNVGLLAAGTSLRYHPETDRAEVAGKTNVVPKTAVLAGDLRTLTIEDRERAKRDIQQIAASGSLPRTQASVEFRDTYPPMAPTAGNWALFDRLDQVSVDLGYPRIEEVDPRAKGAADISVIAHLVDATDGLGPVGGGAHTHQETIELPSLPVVAKRAAVFLHRLATDAEKKATWREGAAAR